MEPRFLQTQFEGRRMFAFVEPDLRAMDRLRQLLISMHAIPLTPDLMQRAATQRTLRADLDAVVARLSSLLKSDNLDFGRDAEVNADYEVRASELIPSAMHINTRVFYIGHGENVFYGRLIQRLGANDYLLWYGDYSAMFETLH